MREAGISSLRVIPAKAGIQLASAGARRLYWRADARLLDSGLRLNDDSWGRKIPVRAGMTRRKP
jgi:hypothetical protein